MRAVSLIVAVFGLAATLAALGVSSAGAGATCSVPIAKVIYQTPALTFYRHRRNSEHTDTLVCIRATGRLRTVDSTDDEGGVDDDTEVVRIYDGRWVWMAHSYASGMTDGSGAAVADLQTGRTVFRSTEQNDDGTIAEVGALGVPGALVLSNDSGDNGPTGITAVLTSTGRELKLDNDSYDSLAGSEHEVYWMHDATPNGRALPLTTATATTTPTTATPTPTTPKAPPVARRAKAKFPCLTPHTTVLLRTDHGHVWVYRASDGTVTACADSKHRRTILTKALAGVTATGPPTDIADLVGNAVARDGTLIAYSFPARTTSGSALALVILNTASGKVVRSVLAPATVTEWIARALSAGDTDEDDTILYTDGEALTEVDMRGTRRLATGAIENIAAFPDVGDYASGYGGSFDTQLPARVYWTDGDTVRTAVALSAAKK